MKENLSIIIKNIEADSITSEEVLLYIDHISKEVTKEKPKGGIFSKLKYSIYQIDETRSIDFNTDFLVFHLGSKTDVESLEFRFKLKISCFNGELLVKALHSNFKILPYDALEKLLYIWATHLLDGMASDLSTGNYKDELKRLLPEIIKEKGKLIGLMISEVNILFDVEDVSSVEVRPIDKVEKIVNLDILDTPIYLKGFEEAVYFNTKLTVKQNENFDLEEPSIETLLFLTEDKIKEFFSGKPFEYIRDNEEEWKVDLKNVLDSVLILKGRVLEEMIVKYSEPDFVKCTTTIINHDTELSLKSIGKKIIIGNELLLTLEDTERFISQKEKIGNFENWIKENLDEVIKINLFGKTIKELALPSQFEDARNNISIQITDRIRKVGYDLKYIISEPNLSIKRSLTEGVRIETTKKFETIAAKAFANFEIILEGKVDSLEDISEYLYLEYDDFKKKIHKTTIEEFKSIIHKTHPESIFSIDTDSLGIEDVKDQLTLHVGTMLKERYGLKELDITIKFLDTELSDRFKKFANKSPRINLKLLINNIEIPFKIRYEIIGINNSGWSIFQRRSTEFSVDKEIEELNRFMYEELVGKFKDIRDIEGDDYLMGRQNRVKLRNEVLAFAQERVIRKFGLEIDLMIDNHNTPLDELGRRQKSHQQSVIDKEQEKYDRIRIQKYFDMRTIYLDKEYELQHEILNSTSTSKKEKLREELRLLKLEISSYERGHRTGVIEAMPKPMIGHSEEE